MTRLRVAMIPVDRNMAVAKRWRAMPLDELVKRLTVAATDAVLRVDQPVPPGTKAQVAQDALYYEVSF